MDGAGDHLAAVSLLWPQDSASGLPTLAFASLRDSPAASWSTIPLPPPPGGSAPNPWAAAQAPDGTLHVVQTSLAGTFLTSGRDGGWTTAPVSASLAFPDVAVDADGVPHVCAAMGPDVVEWTPAGTRTMLRGFPGDMHECALAAGPEGAM